MKAQLTELLSNYGPIAGVWFDGYWDQLENDKNKSVNSPTKVDWHMAEIYALIHKLQPAAMIGNNHHQTPLSGEDFQMFEKDLPGANSTGFGGASISRLPLETCETMNDSWGYNMTDHNYKSAAALIQLLVKDAGYGANLLLNIGPLPNGEIQSEFTSRLDSMGTWLKAHGETIYGTKGGFVSLQDWGAVTERGNKVWIHLFKTDGDKFFLKVPYKVKTATMGGKTLKTQKLDGGYLMIDLKGVELDPVDAIVTLDVIK